PNTVVARQLYWGWSTFAPRPGARARQLYWGWSTFAPRPDGGVLALSFVTALIARPWKVGVRVRITCGNVPGAPPYSWQKLAECELDCSGTIDARFCAWRTPGGVCMGVYSGTKTDARIRAAIFASSNEVLLRGPAPMHVSAPGARRGGEKCELM